ncbi:MAG: VCBS repeat-containing protein [Thermoflexales bacterium]|nr:VCBS repeat-containing protein [Thermoflexales bacterium]
MLVLLCGELVSGASQSTTKAHHDIPPIISAPVSGTLHFVEVYTFSMTPYNSDDQTAADFDRDGQVDIVMAEILRPALASRLVLLHNLGNWQFAPTTLIAYPTAGSYLYQVEAADFNQDHWPDLVLRNDCEIQVLLNDQQGGFTTAWIGSDDFRYCGETVAVADMNGDTALDIVAGEQSALGGVLDLFLNNGSGTVFTLTWHSPPLGAVSAGNVRDIVLGDLNQDAVPDIVASEIYSALLTTFTGDGTGLTFTQVLSQASGARTYSLAGGHLNGDALVDVVLNTDGVLRAFTARSSGSLSETWTNLEAGVGVAQVLADFDRDGYDDLAASSFLTGHLSVYLNQPLSNTLQLVWKGQVSNPPIYDCTAADLNGDGQLELIVGSESVLSVYRSVWLTQRFFLPIVRRN